MLPTGFHIFCAATKLAAARNRVEIKTQCFIFSRFQFTPTSFFSGFGIAHPLARILLRLLRLLSLGRLSLSEEGQPISCAALGFLPFGFSFSLGIIPANVLELGAVADFGAQNCQYTTNVDAR
jgi:hypothetical protein